MSDFSLQWSSLLPGWLAWLLILGLAGAAAFGTIVLARRGVPRPWITILGSLRAAIVVVFALILFPPVFSYSSADSHLPELLVLVDRSQSMALPSGAAGKSRWEQVTEQLQR